MSKSRQSKIEQIRQQSVEALREARIQALHATDRNTPLVSEDAKNTLPPPPPPGAAGGASSSGGGIVDRDNCELPGQCSSSGLLFHQKGKTATNLDFIDIPAYEPTKASLDTITAAQGDYATYWREKNEEFIKTNQEWLYDKFTGKVVLTEEPGIPTPLDKGGQGQTGIGKIGGHTAIPWSLGPSLKVWGYDFEFKFISQVTSIGDLPPSLEYGTGAVCFVAESGAYYINYRGEEPGWKPDGEGPEVPNSNGGTMSLAQVWSDWNACLTEQYKGFNELNQSNPDAVWAGYYLPQYILLQAGFKYGNEEVG